MRRNLTFWTRYTWESAGVELLVAAVLVLITAFGTDSMQLQLLASVIPFYLFVSGAFCVVNINMGSQTLYVPLLISMGETRRNVFLGFQYYRLLILTATTLLSALIWLLIPGQVSALGWKSLPTLVTALVLFSSVGSLMGTLFTKWKWVGTVFMILICGGMGSAVGFTLTSGVQLEQAGTVEIATLLCRLPWWLVLAAAVLLALDLGFHWLVLRRREVKL